MAVLYPDIIVELLLEATHRPISKLLAKEIDLAIVTNKPSDENLVSLPMFEDEIFAIMHREHPLANQEYLESHDFSKQHLIIHSFPLETVSVYEYFLRPHQVVPIKITAIPLTEVALEMVNSNMGIICMPKWALRSFRLGEDICLKRIGINGLKRTHRLTIRKADQHKKYIQDFIINFQEMFGSH